MLSMGGRLWKMMQKMVELYLGESWEVHTCVTSSHRWCQARGVKDQPHTHTHAEWNTDTHSHWLLHALHKLTGVPSWLITFNIFIIYTPPAALQQYIIRLHSAPSALCHKKTTREEPPRTTCTHERKRRRTLPTCAQKQLVSDCVWSPFADPPPSLPPSQPLHPRCRAIMPVNWSWRESGTPWHWAANAEMLH